MSIGMYSTRVFHPKVAESYLNLGDPYDKAQPVDLRYKGKQFQTIPSKLGQLGGYFEDFQYSTDSYQDTNAYRVSQPKSGRKSGFGSGDASRRDEFTLEIRAQQYKELLAKELQFQARQAQLEKQRYTQRKSQEHDEKQEDSLDTFTNTTNSNTHNNNHNNNSEESKSDLFQTQVPSVLYDIGRTHITPICNKCSRETFYCKHRINTGGSTTLRRTGPLKTMAEQIGAEIKQHNIKPTHGTRSQLKDFYDNNHLSVFNYE